MDLDAGPSPDMDVDAVAADAAVESLADPAAASLVWHTRPDKMVELPGPAAVMDDADDAEEDDVDMLQVCVCGIACACHATVRREHRSRHNPP